MDESLAWPPEIRVRFGSQEAIRSRSSGEVRSMDWLDFRTLQPVPDGLFCPRIFGPPRAWGPDRWGHIELAAPVVHTELYQGRPSVLAVALRMPQAELERLLQTDPDALPARWEALDRSRVVEELRARGGDRITPRTLAGRLAALELLEQEPPLLRCVPVIPAGRRPYRLRGTRALVHDVNDLYRIVMNRSHRVRILGSIAAPPEILLTERRHLQAAVDALIANRSQPRPRLGRDDRPLHSLADIPWADEQ